MHQHALYYSADSSATIGKLKSGDYIFDGETRDVESWMDSHNVSAWVAGESDYFYGFGLLPSAPYVVYAMGDTSLLHRPKLAIV